MTSSKPSTPSVYQQLPPGIRPLPDEQYRALVEGINDYGIFMLDPTGRILSWNAGAAIIKGYAAEEIIGKHFSQFYAEEARLRRWPDYELVMAAKLGRFEDEGWRVRKDGSQFWASVVISAVHNGVGELIGFSKVTRDLTERRRAEEALRQSEEQFRLLVDGVRDYAILMLDVQGYVRTWNAGAESIKGYAASEIIGQHFSRFYTPEANEKNWPAHELEVATRSGRFEEEGWRLRKDGTRFWANVIITALRDTEGNLLGFAKVTRDISERQRVDELKKSSREMTEFLAMLSHELRNPLAPITNAVAILELHDTTDPVVVSSRELIRRQATQLSRLVDDLLDVSRMTSGKIALVLTQLDLRDVTRYGVEACEAAANARNHAMKVVVPGKPVYVTGDFARLTQVVTNLVNNAVKYTEAGGSILVALEESKGKAVIRVTDNGIGLRPELIERIFDLFAQEERGLSRSEGGLGVGLSLVRRLVEMHGGIVTASSPGLELGSTFEVQLPLFTVKPVSVERTPAARVARTPHRIMLVDDNADAVVSLSLLLTHKGHAVASAADGPSALALMDSFKPELVLLDIGLPRMSGYDVATHVRNDPALAGVVLCAMTGYGQEEDRRRTRDAGFDHHFTKPVDLSALDALIESLPRTAAV
ncbi:MAG: PAS domain S-box protein [Gemmatimonadaceae bacterium]